MGTASGITTNTYFSRTGVKLYVAPMKSAPAIGIAIGKTIGSANISEISCYIAGSHVTTDAGHHPYTQIIIGDGSGVAHNWADTEILVISLQDGAIYKWDGAAQTLIGGTVANDTWYHLRLVFDNTDVSSAAAVDVYLDGVLVGSTTWDHAHAILHADTLKLWFSKYGDDVDITYVSDPHIVTVAELGKFSLAMQDNDETISYISRQSGVQADLDRRITVSFTSQNSVEMLQTIINGYTGFMWEDMTPAGSDWSVTFTNKTIREIFKILQNHDKKLIRIARTGEVTFTAVASLPSTGLTLTDTNILDLTKKNRRVTISEVHLIGIGITSDKYSTTVQNQSAIYDYYPISDQTALDAIAQSILDTKYQQITTLYVQVNSMMYFQEYGQSLTVTSTFYDVTGTWYITKCAQQDGDTVMFELEDVVEFQNERSTSDAEPITRAEAKADAGLAIGAHAQTTADTKVSKAGDTMTDNLNFADTKGISTSHDAILNAATSHKVKAQVNGTSIVEHEATKSTHNQDIDFADGKGISASHDAILNAATSHSVKLRINGSDKLTTDGTNVDFGSQNLKAYKFPGLVAERLSRNKSYSPLNTNANYRIALESTSGNNPVMNSTYITSFGNNRTTFQVAISGYYLVTVQAFFLTATQYHHVNFGYYPTSSTKTNLNTIDRVAWTNNGVVCRGSFIVYLETGKDYGFWVYNSNTSGDYDIYNTDDSFQTASVCFLGVAP